MSETRLPTIIVPYAGPSVEADVQDIFVYLRPETNGVKAESRLFRVIHDDPRFRDGTTLVYLANIPGDFIVRNHVVEQHYATRLYFTRRGKSAFTAEMRRKFTSHFGVEFDSAEIEGAFQAVDDGRFSRMELYARQVPADDLLELNGQTVKRFGDLFVVNYDIPTILRQNNRDTDVAVMIFRCRNGYPFFQEIVAAVSASLVECAVLDPALPPARVFHYSRGPFEQILDGLGYLYDETGQPLPPQATSFCAYLIGKGIPLSDILHAIQNPIMHFRSEDGTITEANLLTFTRGESFEEAYRKLLQVFAQPLLSFRVPP